MFGPDPHAGPAATPPARRERAGGPVPAIHVGARLELAEELRQEWLRLAAALREALHATVDLDAPPGRLRELADRAVALSRDLAAHAGGRAIALASSRAAAPAERVDGPDEADDAPPPFGALSGRYNPLAPPLEVTVEKGHVVARVCLGEAFQGEPGSVHSGVLAALVDEVIGLATVARGVPGRIESLSVRLQAPVALGEELHLEARVGRIQKRRVQVSATCRVRGEVVAEAEARCQRVHPSGWSRRSRGLSR